MNQRRHIHEAERFRKIIHEHGGLIALICREAFDEEHYHQEALRQRILERLWNNMPRMPLLVDWKRWIWKVSLNERSSYLRSKEYHDSQRWQRMESWMEDRPPEAEDQRRQRMEWLLTQLEEEERELMELFLEGEPRAELAERYRCSLSTIDRRLTEIKLKMKTLHEQDL